MTTDLPTEKHLARRLARARLTALSPAVREARSAAIRDLLAALPAFQSARAILAFAPLPDEPDLAPLFVHAIAAGTSIALPRVDWSAGTMIPALIRHWPTDLAPDRHGLLAPNSACPPLKPDKLDLVLVPGLAFDRLGHRLGRGKGFYDRFLAPLHPRILRLAVAFQAQVLDTVPAGPEDCTVSALVTEAGTLTFR